MAVELIDFRVKITPATDNLLDALAAARQCDRAEVARRALDEWARQHIHESIVVARVCAPKGNSGHRVESTGSRSDE